MVLNQLDGFGQQNTGRVGLTTESHKAKKRSLDGNFSLEPI
jgi:hypothetical protein